jgi:hypothetical protein
MHLYAQSQRLSESEGGRPPIVGIHRLLIAAVLLLSELFGPVALVSLNLAR